MEPNTGTPTVDDVPQCPRCRAFHTDDKTGRWVAAVCKSFDPTALCKLCGEPVCGLSMSGPEICPLCDAGPDHGSK